MASMKVVVFAALVAVCYARGGPIPFTDPTLNLDVKKAIIVAVNELDKSSRTVWKEKVTEVISYKQTYRGEDIIYDITAKLARSTCNKTDWTCVPNPLHGKGSDEHEIKYTVPFQAPLGNFFLLPYEERKIEIIGSMIPADPQKGACFMLQNGPVYDETTSLPFKLCLEFPRPGHSSVTIKHWWNKEWKQDEQVDSSDWLRPGQDFTLKVNFQKDSAQISMNGGYGARKLRFEYQIPIETTHLYIRGAFHINDVKIASIVEEFAKNRICTLKVLERFYGLKWLSGWECEYDSPEDGPSPRKGMMGGLSPADQKSPPFTQAINYAMTQINKVSTLGTSKLVLNQVIDAKQQVAAGILYHLTLHVVPTNCAKDAPATENCEVLTGQTGYKCALKVVSRPWQDVVEVAGKIDCTPM